MYERGDLIGFCIERVLRRVCVSQRWYILAIAFRLAEVEREVVLAPEHQKPGVRLLQPKLPFRIGLDIRAVVIEEIALNLRLSQCV